MTSKTMKLGENGLLSLAGELQIQITKIASKRKSKLFCAKHQQIAYSSFLLKHECLKPRRVYTNEEGEKVIILCPKLMVLDLSGEKPQSFYKLEHDAIYESLEQICLVRTEFKHKPKPLEKKEEDIFTKQARNLAKIVDAGKQLTGSA